MEILAVTDPEKYAQIKQKMNEKKKKNRSSKNKLLSMYKHDTLAKKLNKF